MLLHLTLSTFVLYLFCSIIMLYHIWITYYVRSNLIVCQFIQYSSPTCARTWGMMLWYMYKQHSSRPSLLNISFSPFFLHFLTKNDNCNKCKKDNPGSLNTSKLLLLYHCTKLTVTLTLQERDSFVLYNRIYINTNTGQVWWYGLYQNAKPKPTL